MYFISSFLPVVTNAQEILLNVQRKGKKETKGGGKNLSPDGQWFFPAVTRFGNRPPLICCRPCSNKDSIFSINSEQGSAVKCLWEHAWLYWEFSTGQLLNPGKPTLSDWETFTPKSSKQRCFKSGSQMACLIKRCFSKTNSFFFFFLLILTLVKGELHLDQSLWGAPIYSLNLCSKAGCSSSAGFWCSCEGSWVCLQ